MWQVVVHNGLDHNCDRTVTFLVKELLCEVVILGSMERQLERAEGNEVTAYTAQVHCSRLKLMGILICHSFRVTDSCFLPLAFYLQCKNPLQATLQL